MAAGVGHPVTGLWWGALSAFAADVWESPRDGVELLTRTTGGGTPQQIVAAYVDLCETGVQARSTTYDERQTRTSAWADDVDAFVAINGAFFDYTYYHAIGYQVGDGEVWPSSSDASTFSAMGFATYGRARLWEPDDVLPPARQDWWENVVPGRPVLVDDGVIVQEACFSHMCERHPRSAVGLTEDGRTAILVAVDGRRSGASGMTRLELAALMADLGAHRALNLDGGGSTTLVVNGDVVNTPSDGSERVVASHLGFVEGPATPCCAYEAVAGATGVFEDVPDAHFAKPYAEALYAGGITSGCQQSPELLFCPDCVADRVVLGVFLARALDLQPISEVSFDDIAPDAWYGDTIEALRAAGITSGCAPGAYCPERLATRFEAAAMVKRAAGLPDAAPSGRFVDLTPDEARVVEALADACVVSGCAADRFCPDDPVTRGQLAKLVAIGLEVSPFSRCGGGEDSGDTGSDTGADTGDTGSEPDTGDTGSDTADTGSDTGADTADTGSEPDTSDTGSDTAANVDSGETGEETANEADSAGDADDSAVVVDDLSGGCGCASGSRGAGAGLAAVGLLALRRRRTSWLGSALGT